MLAHLALDVAREPRAPVVHRQDHPGDGEARVQLALDQRERVEQAGEPLEREVLGLHRHDHAVGGHERVDGERAERRRAVEQREQVALAHRAEPLAQARLGARRSAAARRSRPRARAWTAPGRAARRPPVGRAASSSVSSPDEAVVDVRASRPSAARARPWRCTAGPGPRAGSDSPRRPRSRRGSRRWSSCRRRPSGWRSRRRCPCSGETRRRPGRKRLCGQAVRGRTVDLELRFGADQPSGRLRAIPGRRGKPAGRGRHLADHVQVAVAGALEGLHRAHRLDLQPERRRRRGAAALLAGVQRALPGDEHAALAQQRRRVLDEQRERARAPGR